MHSKLKGTKGSYFEMEEHKYDKYLYFLHFLMNYL